MTKQPESDFIELGLLSYQADFLESESVHTGLVAGYGAGKSKAGTIKTIEKKKLYPGIPVAYYLPTYGLIKDIAFKNFKDIFRQMRIPYELNASEHTFTTPLGQIICRSMNNPENIIGYEVGYSLIDECDVVPKKRMLEAFKNIVARNRVSLPDGLANSIDMVSTPEGFEFMYDFFVKNKKPSRKLIRAKSKDNPFLPESYFETLYDIYTEEQIKAYIEGEFVNLTTGIVFRSYDRVRNNSSEQVLSTDKLHVGIDFNITNMSAVFHKVLGKEVHAVDEITGAFDTAELIKLILEKYPNHKIIVYPDASGNNRNTAGDSDIKLLRKARFTVRVPKKNPSIKDRITTANGAFLNAKGESTYYVNPEACPDYAEALEKLPYKNGIPDKASGYDHITDAGTYPLYQIKSEKGKVRITAG